MASKRRAVLPEYTIEALRAAACHQGPIDTPKELGGLLQAARKRNGLLSREVAAAAGLSESYVRAMECGTQRVRLAAVEALLRLIHPPEEPDMQASSPSPGIHIGQCSNCSGDVTVPSSWAGTGPPRPTCTRCGAEAETPGLPVIPMAPSPFSAQQPDRRLSIKGRSIPGWAIYRSAPSEDV